jgi:hypothetical protein
MLSIIQSGQETSARGDFTIKEKNSDFELYVDDQVNNTWTPVKKEETKRKERRYI